MIVIRNVLHADGLRRAGGLFHANLACACTGSLTAAPSMAMPTSGQLNCKFCEEEAILQGRESILRPRGLSSKQRLSYTAHRQEASGPMEGKASALAALKARRQQAATAALGAGSTGGAQDSMGSEAAAEAVGTSGRAEPQGLPAGAIAPGAVARKSAKTWAWICSMCNNECVPVRTESRCLCGHRLKVKAGRAACSWHHLQLLMHVVETLAEKDGKMDLFLQLTSAFKTWQLLVLLHRSMKSWTKGLGRESHASGWWMGDG